MLSNGNGECSVHGCGRQSTRRCGHCDRLLCDECWCPKDVEDARRRRETAVSYAHKAFYPPWPEDVRPRP